MRRLFAALLLLAACLSFVQATSAAVTSYSACCLDDCAGMSQCASPSCQACQSAAAAPNTTHAAVGNRSAPAPAAPGWRRPSVPRFEVWRPPDGT